jgi:hypothetical protein
MWSELLILGGYWEDILKECHLRREVVEEILRSSSYVKE